MLNSMPTFSTARPPSEPECKAWSALLSLARLSACWGVRSPSRPRTVLVVRPCGAHILRWSIPLNTYAQNLCTRDVHACTLYAIDQTLPPSCFDPLWLQIEICGARKYTNLYICLLHQKDTGSGVAAMLTWGCHPELVLITSYSPLIVAFFQNWTDIYLRLCIQNFRIFGLSSAHSIRFACTSRSLLRHNIGILFYL